MVKPWLRYLGAMQEISKYHFCDVIYTWPLNELGLTYIFFLFKVQGEAIDKVAKKTIRVLVVGNPANTNAAIW